MGTKISKIYEKWSWSMELGEAFTLFISFKNDTSFEYRLLWEYDLSYTRARLQYLPNLPTFEIIIINRTMPNLSLAFLKYENSVRETPTRIFPAGLPGIAGSLGAARREGREASDERIRSALERKNVTVVRPQGEEKLAVARHWPKPRRRSERSPLRRFLFARTCLGSARLPPTGLLSSRFSRRASPLFYRIPRRGHLSLLLSPSLGTDRSRKIITDGWSFNRKALGRATSGTWRLFFIQELCTDCALYAAWKKWTGILLIPYFSFPLFPPSPRNYCNYRRYNRCW